MSAQDDYPRLGAYTGKAAKDVHPFDVECESALREIDNLRRWKAEAEVVIEEWDQLWEEVGCPGELGKTKAAGLLAALKGDGVI